MIMFRMAFLCWFPFLFLSFSFLWTNILPLSYPSSPQMPSGPISNVVQLSTVPALDHIWAITNETVYDNVFFWAIDWRPIPGKNLKQFDLHHNSTTNQVQPYGVDRSGNGWLYVLHFSSLLPSPSSSPLSFSPLPPSLLSLPRRLSPLSPLSPPLSLYPTFSSLISYIPCLKVCKRYNFSTNQWNSVAVPAFGTKFRTLESSSGFIWASINTASNNVLRGTI